MRIIITAFLMTFGSFALGVFLSSCQSKEQELIEEINEEWEALGGEPALRKDVTP